MRIRGNAVAANFLAEIIELLFGEPPFQEGTPIDTRRRVTLDQHEIAAVIFVRRMPKMHKASIVERCRGLKAGQMPTQFRRMLIGAKNDRQRVPAYG